MQLVDVSVTGYFEVFNSGGSWAFLLGKPLLRRFNAKQDFEADTVEITANNGSVTTLQNELNTPRATTPTTEGTSLTLDIKQLSVIPDPLTPTVPPPMKESETPLPVYVTSTNEAAPSIFTRESNPHGAE